MTLNPNNISENDLKGLTELSDRRYNKYFDWIKHLLLTATGLIGILVSLKSGKSETTFGHYAFVITIITLGLGILSGSFLLYSEISNLDKARKLYANKLIELMKGIKDPISIGTVDTSRVFKVAEIVCYVSFIGAVISLTIYAILSD